MYYVGLDVHKQYCMTAVLDEPGQLIGRCRLASEPVTLRQYFRRFDQPAQVALEACYNWGYFFDILQDCTQEVVLAHPLKTRLIAEARIKTDAIDARVLAELLRAKLLPVAYAPSAATRAVKNYLRYRAGLAMLDTQVKNKIHALLDQHDYPQRSALGRLADLFGKQGLALLRTVELPGSEQAVLESWLQMHEQLASERRQANAWIRAAVKEDRWAQLLKTIPGIGDQFALLVRYEVDRIGRFANAKKLVGYIGLAPCTWSSGGHTRHGAITKQGNKWLRWAMVEAAQKAPMTSPYFAGYYERIKQRAGFARARVATARKLAELVYGVMKTHTEYREPVSGPSPSTGSNRTAAATSA
jgi:transposase